ncbi:GGDEF domain-containing response regulator [Andreprevotia chitinilytica]|uniref:GGDEF domain-containing response regulator n=1 Tax=Andreprevotia chitinilytica TaxID=396808 RepID=UPI00068E6402|nr:diguanylate cyclase [Andreprevotia chitinilytica]
MLELVERPILILCAEAETGSALADALKSFGFDSIAFQRPAALLVALAETKPQAVLLDDTGLEGGLALQELVQRLSRIGNWPLVLLSSQQTIVSQIQLLRAGVSDFISKPCDPSKLADRLDALLENNEPIPYRILIVDDSVASGHWAQKVLESSGMQAKHIQDPLEIFLWLQRYKPDLVLMDVYMPHYTGDEIARIVRQHPQYDGLPIVFLSTETRLGHQLSARRMGGEDFLVKNNDIEQLISTVSIVADRYRKLRRALTRDSLTGLLSHTHFTTRLQSELFLSTQSDRPLALAMIDIDHFKNVNDTYGHLTGDAVIKSLARLLRHCAQEPDLVGRYGGEEFCVILPDMTYLRAAQRVDEWRERFAAIYQLTSEGKFSSTFSAGVASFEQGMSVRDLIEQADQGLYRAKAAGRNQVGLAKMPSQVR